jgi:hypothetical protein
MKFVDSASSIFYAAGGSKSTKFCIDPAVLKHSPLSLGLAVATNSAAARGAALLEKSRPVGEQSQNGVSAVPVHFEQI